MESGFKAKEVKKLGKLNMHTLYLRLLLYKNHPNMHNFFNQVGISHVVVEGTGYDYILPAMRVSQVSSHQRNQFVEAKLAVLAQFKERFVEE